MSTFTCTARAVGIFAGLVFAVIGLSIPASGQG